MRTTTRMETHAVRDWFPPEDEMASHVARLCILREDWWLEFNGYVSEEDFKSLDSTSQVYRRLYFLRSLITTLTDIHETIKALNSMESFRTALESCPKI